MVTIEQAFSAIENGDLGYLRTFTRLHPGSIITNAKEGRRTLLHQAVIHQNIDAMTIALQIPGIVNFVDARKRTALHYAAYYGNEKIVSFLLDYRSSVKEQDDRGFTALHHAAIMGRDDCLLTLIAAGADPFICCRKGRNVLFHAHKHNQTSVVCCLLSQIPTLIYEVDKGNQSIAHHVAKSDNSELVAFITERFPLAIFLQHDSQGFAPLHYFAKMNYTNALKYCIARQSCPPDYTARGGFTPLHIALLSGSKESTLALLLALADPMIEIPHSGDVALHLATKTGQTQLIPEILNATAVLNHHVDVDLRNRNGRTPLMEAAYFGHVSAVSLLLSIGANWSAVDSEGNSALLLCSIQNKPFCVEAILDFMADTTEHMSEVDDSSENRAENRIRKVLLNTRNKAGESALHWLCFHGHLSLARKLVHLGADIMIDNMDSFNNSIHYAARSGKTELVHYLLTNHVPLTKNKAGQTPLHFASRYGFADVCRILVQNGADSLSDDENGMTPLKLSSVYNHAECEIILSGVSGFDTEIEVTPLN